MAKLSFAAILLAAGAGVFLFPFSFTNADEQPAPAKSITVSELGKLQVIGWLGQPLGTVITVEGVIADGSYTNTKADAGHTLLRIQTVDGKKLPKEQVFQYPRVDKPKVGSTFKYIGYETGAFTGIPAKVFDYKPPFASTGYGFTTEFRVIRDEMMEQK